MQAQDPGPELAIKAPFHEDESDFGTDQEGPDLLEKPLPHHMRLIYMDNKFMEPHVRWYKTSRQKYEL